MTLPAPMDIPLASAPLLTLETALFRLPLRAGRALAPMDVVPAFRSRLGAVLKSRFCLFPAYKSRSCNGCERAKVCYYTMMFAPEGDGKTSLPRPYGLSLSPGPGQQTIPAGAKTCLILTLFGPEAIRFYRPMLESLFHGALSLEKELSITPSPWQVLVPKEETCGSGGVTIRGEKILSKSCGAPLSQWIRALPEPGIIPENPGRELLELRFFTPFQLKRMPRDFGFTPFVRSIIARLRDLKRAWSGGDTDMGTFSAPFFSAADHITAFSGLSPQKGSWYSRYRDRAIDLGGPSGRIMLKGELSPFLPLMGAGFFTGVGSKTVYGLGRFDLPGWEEFMG